MSSIDMTARLHDAGFRRNSSVLTGTFWSREDDVFETQVREVREGWEVTVINFEGEEGSTAFFLIDAEGNYLRGDIDADTAGVLYGSLFI